MIRNIIFLVFWIVLFSCARIGNPSGGPKDRTPPKFLKASPDTFALQVSTNRKEIRIDFDEYITLKDAQTQIIISPPLDQLPAISPSSSQGRKFIEIKLSEALNENTTYNINFGESIRDLNEGNKLPLFNYIFSTGDYIDSLQLKGNVRAALRKNLNENMVMALYRKDTAEFDLLQKPYYVTKVDSAGEFNFNYLHEGIYRLIGFADENANLRCDPEEHLAFADSLVNPQENHTYQLVISQNKPAYKMRSSKQVAAGEIEFVMEGKPQYITFKSTDEKWVEDYRFLHVPYSDTAYVYFNGEELNFDNSKERLEFFIEHLDLRDTISVLYDQKLESPLRVSNTIKNPLPNKSIYLESSNALRSINPDSIRVFQDSTLIDFKVEIDSLKPKRVRLDFPISFESNYTLELFPGALKDYTHQTQDTLSFNMKSLEESEYGNLNLSVLNAPTHPFIFQLMANEEVIESKYGRETSFQFKHLPPKEYSFRILVDENENGQWDMADFAHNKQAEKTYIYQGSILVRAFWDLNETWTLPEIN